MRHDLADPYPASSPPTTLSRLPYSCARSSPKYRAAIRVAQVSSSSGSSGTVAPSSMTANENGGVPSSAHTATRPRPAHPNRVGRPRAVAVTARRRRRQSVRRSPVFVEKT